MHSEAVLIMLYGVLNTCQDHSLSLDWVTAGPTIICEKQLQTGIYSSLTERLPLIQIANHRQTI